MKTKRILSLVLAFLMMLTSVGVFAEETTETPYQLPLSAIELRDNIAEAICDTEDGWTAFTMALYEKYALGENTMSDATKRTITDAYISEAQKPTATASDRARIEIVLSALGKDTTSLYPVGEEKVDNSALLSESDHTASGHYAAPWILLANMQGNTNLSDEQIGVLIDVLDQAKGDGTFGYEWDGITYSDPDTAGAVLAALSHLTGNSEFITYIISGLYNVIDENGSFGSANSDAMVIIGLLAVGENPYEFKNENTGKSVVDGLLSYANESNNGFTFYGSDNFMATEQGLRALIALSAYNGESLNIYDFSDVEKTPAYQYSSEKITTIRDNIASVIKDTDDMWTAFTMSIYEEYDLGENAMSEDAKQSILNQAINLAKSDSATAGDRAKIEIVLRSQGIDTKNLYPLGQETPIDNGAELKNADHLASGHYSAPWILLADIQGNTELSAEQIAALITALDSAKGTGLFESVWDGITYTDADTAAVTLSALARYYGTNEETTQLCDAILDALENTIDENGSFGSANSDAMVIIGLASMGINPYDFRNETTQKSVADGLLSYANEGNNGFTFYGSDNFMATEQGLRALVVLSVYEDEALNIYDFSEKQVIPGYETTEEPEEPEEEPTRPSGGSVSTTIRVKLTIKPNGKTWISKRMTLPKKSTVYDALKEISETTEIEIDGIDEGYIKSITYKGDTLSEFDYGKNSGWMYKVNNKVPKVGFDSYKLSDDDEILWYYTEDWEEKEDDKSHSDKTPSEKDEEKTTTITFSDTENHWAKDAIIYVSQKGIMNGVSDSTFAPDEKLTRGMLVTMLYRLSGDEAKGENSFSDISLDAWYKDAAVWASENNITNGYGNGKFGADDEVTREQLAVFLKRYADLKDARFDKTETEEFNDTQNISSWAKDATLWAKDSGILSGRENNRFDPASGATRAEIAMVFMRFIENVAK